uniref:Uncharacterized protein n=1 Tax=viral metagenome TaxID=1070528 RepID=A0A6H1ZVW0_9ZZZZ
MAGRVSSKSAEEVLQSQFCSSEQAQLNVMRNYPYTARLVGGALTTAGVQWGALSTLTTGPATSKSSNMITVLSSTISWPGLDGEYIDEMEVGLTASLRSTVHSTVSETTVGFVWQIKDQSETTWTNINTAVTLRSTIAAERTVSGYRMRGDATLATGYNKLPINIRMRAYTKNSSPYKGRARVKSSSYVIVKSRHTA